jgi:CheY-like chemotaxis protein
VEDIFEEFDRVHFSLEEDFRNNRWSREGALHPGEKPKILLVAGVDFARLCREHIPAVQWYLAETKEEAAAVLASTEVDLVLLDLWLPSGETETDLPGYGGVRDLTKTISQDLDFVPLSARALTRGREILRKIHDSFPDKPVYLLSFENEGPEQLPAGVRTATFVFDASQGWEDMPLPDAVEVQPRRAVDEELFLACVRSGGARGLIATDFNDDRLTGWNERRDRFRRAAFKNCGAGLP